MPNPQSLERCCCYNGTMSFRISFPILIEPKLKKFPHNHKLHSLSFITRSTEIFCDSSIMSDSSRIKFKLRDKKAFQPLIGFWSPWLILLLLGLVGGVLSLVLLQQQLRGAVCPAIVNPKSSNKQTKKLYNLAEPSLNLKSS